MHAWLRNGCLGLLALVALAAVRTSAAQSGATLPSFQAMGVNRPFQTEVITEVLQDQVGFLWIGTREGLYMHDGQRFRSFQHEVQNPDSMSSSGIRGLFEDSRGRLWINTINGGLNLLDRGTWRFKRWRHDASDPASLIHDGVFALAEADDGRLWVGTQAGLDLFDPDTGRFQRQVLATGGEFVMTLMRDREGRLWVGTIDQGLFRQNAERDGFDPVMLAGSTESLDVFSVAQDASGRVWVGTRDSLLRYDPATDRLLPSGVAPEPARALANVTALEPDREGGLWIGTFGSGLYRMEADATALRKVEIGPDVRGMQHVDQGALRVGRDGSLFVGTFGAGLFRHRPDALPLQTWRETREGKPGLRFEDVYALFVGADGNVLAGSFGGGLDAIDPVGGGVTPLMLPVDDVTRGVLSGVLHAIRTRDGAIWAATSEGVFRWDRARGAFRYFRPDSSTGAADTPGYSYAMLEDRSGRVWVGSGGGGLYRYRPGTDDFAAYRPEANNPRSLSNDFVTTLVEDRRGRLWVGTRSGGISLCRMQGERLDCERIDGGTGPREVSHDLVTSLLEAADGAMWVGTGGGLNRVRLDRDGRVAAVERWSRSEGLGDDNVMALVFAPDGALWISTHGGLSRMDSASGRFTNLTPTDGLPTAVFNPKAALLHAGRLYFGSAKGVLALDPGFLPARPPAPVTVITSVGGLADTQLPRVPPWKLRSLRLPLNQPFSLEFAVLGYDGDAPEFQYRLAASAAWTSLGDRGQLTLHALPAGRHRLEVRGRIGGRDWTAIAPLQLDIVPPWWRDQRVQAGALVALLLLLLGGFWWRVRELESRNEALQRAHAQREQALDETKESRDRLQDAFASLRRLTMRLEAAKEEERKHIARELHDEFGQALTATKINLQLARTDPQGAMVDTRMRDALASVDQLIGQVRALSLDLRPPLLDELGLLPALDAYLQAVSQRSGIPLDAHLPPRMPWTHDSRDIVVFRIVQEAVTNALRHAAATRLDVSIQPERGGLLIRVADDGRGFDAEAKLAEVGGGFGLFGMRERVRDLGGEWKLQSAAGKGTTMTAFLPGDVAPAPPPPGLEGEDARDPG